MTLMLSNQIQQLSLTVFKSFSGESTLYINYSEKSLITSIINITILGMTEKRSLHVLTIIRLSTLTASRSLTNLDILVIVVNARDRFKIIGKWCKIS